MPEYADIYGLSSRRTVQDITRFLDRFLTHPVPAADGYELPQFSEHPSIAFTTAMDLIHYCCNNPTESYAIYWHNESATEHAEVFFLSDGNLVIGFSTPSEDPSRVDAAAAEMESFLESQMVIVTYESMPPETTDQFRSLFNSLATPSDKHSRQSPAHRRIAPASDIPWSPRA